MLLTRVPRWWLVGGYGNHLSQACQDGQDLAPELVQERRVSIEASGTRDGQQSRQGHRAHPARSVVPVRWSAVSWSVRELRAATDDRLIAEHDEVARNTSGGVAYYLEELHRRQELAAMRSSQKLAVASFVLASVSALAAIAALLVAVCK